MKDSRDEIVQKVLSIQNPNILLEFSTGLGKSKCTIEKIKQLDIKGKILIVIPRLVLIDNWKDEFTKWEANKYLPQVEFVTYVSLPKKAGESYNAVVYDEVHHLSDRCQSVVPYIKSNYNILLSATIKRTLRPNLNRLFPNLYTYRISLQQAVEDDILPEPRIILIPLKLLASIIVNHHPLLILPPDILNYLVNRLQIHLHHYILHQISHH